MVTPFKNNKEVDFNSLEKLLNHVKKYIDYIIVFGTTSETPTLFHEEKKEILSFIKSKIDKPIVLGMGGYNTAAIINDLKKQN